MTRTLSLTIALAGAALAVSALAPPAAFADEDIMYPSARPNYPFQRAFRTSRVVVIPPYRHLFPVRIYTTPQQQPYYNVPPYPVISPY